MNMPAATTLKATTEARARVAYRTRGHSHGPITRLISPSDVGELIRPFVFLDYFDIDPTENIRAKVNRKLKGIQVERSSNGRRFRHVSRRQ